MNEPNFIDDAALNEAAALFAHYREAMASRIVGQEELVNGLLTALIAGGHILIEGAPGLAKTLSVKCLAAITGLEFKRIQFTPDLLPADLTGTLVWESAQNNFSVRKGPVFANIILADEINRAPAKVQSALLEAMEEYQVTIGDNTWKLPDPFFVLATQNPVEHEGTYPLPEAQLDRFLLKLRLSYPTGAEELSILALNAAIAEQNKMPSVPDVSGFLNVKLIEKLRLLTDNIHLDEKIAGYIVNIVAATRPLMLTGRGGISSGGSGGIFAGGKPDAKNDALALKAAKDSIYRYISYGASPRAAISLHHCAKIQALLAGSPFVRPDDVKNAALPVLRHRLILSYEAEADNLDADTIISRILSFVPAP
ncbi:MAG: AAA family ATPase [Spirochaetaceae bacterium]|jgi:MoxR-like ATPase|nr:AAA family ATPase [Spirochaetaceae bacterium]